MSYTIQIKRAEPISLAEWSEVVRSRTDLRFREEDHVARNPQTGAVITIARAEGEADLHVGDAWLPCFRWRGRQGTIAFNAPGDFDEPESPVRRVALELAKQLNARLVGEEGEEYDDS
jgi:hypothetical protein